MNARSEPLLWLQLIAVGVLPLEALLLLLLLAGSDPGPVPGLERLLGWGLGGLLPAVALWRRPADVWSLLLLQVPLRARRPLQQRLSALQDAPVLRAGLVVGSALLLVLLWWSDEHAAIAGPFSPLAASPRLVGLLLAALLLALMLWQWQQLLQSLWLLSRGDGAIAAAPALTSRELEARRLCLGLPLLLLDPLASGPAAPPPRRPVPKSAERFEPAVPSVSGSHQPAATSRSAAEAIPAGAEPDHREPSDGESQPSEPQASQVTAMAAFDAEAAPQNDAGPQAPADDSGAGIGATSHPAPDSTGQTAAADADQPAAPEQPLNTPAPSVQENPSEASTAPADGFMQGETTPDLPESSPSAPLMPEPLAPEVSIQDSGVSAGTAESSAVADPETGCTTSAAVAQPSPAEDQPRLASD